MFQALSKKIVSSGIRSESIDAEKQDEYIYGMNMFFDVCINIISMLVIGMLMGRVWESIVFCIVYKVIRKYTGGFHFESAKCCYISSCIMYIIAVVGIIFVPFRKYEISVMVVISSIILWFLSPIEAANKPLDNYEKHVYKKRARINIFVILFAYIVFLFINNNVAKVISTGIIWVTLFAVVGYIKVMLYNERDQR